MKHYEDMIRRSPVNNLAFDIIGDVLLTFGFIPFVLFFGTVAQWIPPELIVNSGSFSTACTAMGDLALLFFLLTTILTLPRDGTAGKTGIYYTFLGFLYFSVEMAVFYLAETSFNDPELLDYLPDIFPNNYLLSIAAFNFLFYFLFDHPAKIENSVKKMRLFRLGAILPLLYIFGSFAFAILDGFDIVSLPLPFTTLTSGQYFTQEMVGLIIIFTYFFVGSWRRKHHRKDPDINEAKPLHQNIFLIIVIALVAIADWIFTGLVSEKTVHIVEGGTMRWALVLLPLFLFYHNDRSEETHPLAYKIADWYYTGIYLLLGFVFIITVTIMGTSGA